MRDSASTFWARGAMAMTALTIAGILVLGWLAFGTRVALLERERVVAVEGNGIGQSAHIMITRELCFPKENEGKALRFFIRAHDDPTLEEAEEQIEGPPLTIQFSAGCSIKSRRLDMPQQIQPGVYWYKSGLEWCNEIRRCQTVWLTPIKIRVVGEGAMRQYRPHMPE